ncbi:MAG TPA: glutamine--fructose-6-phosphate transaminase (isomerizing) [Lentisphaeria bacterium]|nr:MAG: glutamine--fructose-6-phosphate aminotransferase [Lentisphaerae bacterium GWF2_38_69]HBM16574.1 glutamine--fructose-6-phosphate transaminase (isomerizing) [Lentisphaeria bacterium]
MCGIVGYVGNRPLIDTLINGLKRLEYRGYDSSGIAFIENNEIRVIKEVGKVATLLKTISQEIENTEFSATGIAHTRWATHGEPSHRNSHPHLDSKGNFAVVHNGIIENYAALKGQLMAKGCKFNSDTDTEVIAHLISELYEGDFLKAVAAALKQLNGTYGIAVISKFHPDMIIAARKGSPIVIGVGNEEMIVASDISALISYTRKVIYLDDNDIAVIKKNEVDIRNIDIIPVNRELAHVDWDAGAAEKGGFDHFMLKEIYEQDSAVVNTIRGRINIEEATAILSGLGFNPRELASISNIIIAACGTSMHAGLVGEYFFEDLAGIPTEVAQAAEFRYRNPIIRPDTLVIAVSQSGETADTLAAVRESKNKGALVAGICNVVGSTIARETGSGIYLHAGPEIGVASTKAFTCQVITLLMMAVKFGRSRRLARNRAIEVLEEIQNVPALIKETLKSAPEIERIAKKYSGIDNAFYIGRGYLYPVALEGALKLKEISYIHAEGYHAAELKHGPIALLEEKVPVIALANDIPGKDKILSNMQECKARKSPIIATATIGDLEVQNIANDVIYLPRCSEYVTPIVTVIALQLFSYYVARERGCSIDQPRNLAKSVTVE